MTLKATAQWHNADGHNSSSNSGSRTPSKHAANPSQKREPNAQPAVVLEVTEDLLSSLGLHLFRSLGQDPREVRKFRYRTVDNKCLIAHTTLVTGKRFWFACRIADMPQCLGVKVSEFILRTLAAGHARAQMESLSTELVGGPVGTSKHTGGSKASTHRYKELLPS